MKKSSFNSLKSRIITAITGVLIVSLLIATIFFRNMAKHELSEAIEGNALNLLQATKNHVESEYNSILYHKTIMLSRRKIELKNNVTLVFSMIDRAYGLSESGLLNEYEAKQRAITAVQQARYDDGVGYFWINDIGRPFPSMVMHPTISDLDGKILDDPEFNCALGKNENLFKAAVDVCLENKEGYVDYLWPKPISDGLTEKQPKISFVKFFKPWNWIIGSGVYIDDIEKDVQNRIDAVIEDLNKTIRKQRIGESGYFFIFDEERNMLVHPNSVGQSNLINPTTGNLLLEELKEAAFSPNHYMEYYWDKPGFEGEYKFPKKAFVTFYEPLGWYIGSSVYKEDFEQIKTKHTGIILLFSISFFIIAIIISLLVSRSISKPLNILVSSISTTGKDGLPINPISSTGITEIEVLSTTINNMIDSIRKSGKELKDERDFSFDLINTSPNIICGLDSKGITTFINPAGERVTGYSKEEIIGTNWWKLLFPNMDNRQIEEMINTFPEGKAFEMTLFNKKGEKRDIVWNSFTKRDNNNNILEVIGFGNNITERKRVKEELSKQNIKYLTLLQNLNGMVYHCNNDKNWTMKFISDGCIKLTEYNPEDLIENYKLSYNSIILPEYQDPVWEHLQDCLSRHEPYELEYQIKTASGINKWVWERGCGIFNKDDKLLHLEGFITDITERKQAEDALQKNEAQLQTLIKTIPDLIWLKNPDGVYLACNPKFERFFGAKETSIVGKTDYDFVEKELADLFRKKDMAAMKANKPSVNEEEVTYADDGHKELLETIKTPMYDSEGRLIGVLGIARDITDRKMAEKMLQARNKEYLAVNEKLQVSIGNIQEINAELLKAKEKAEESDKLKTAFLANMSHEIRTPMNGILGFANLLKGAKLTGDQKQEFISIIEKSGERMLNIINDLIDISKIESNQMKISVKETNINEQIEYLYVFFKPLTNKKGIRLSFKNTLPETESIIKSDKEKILAILTNLLKNAVKFSNNGSIEFGYYKKDDYIEFFVKDKGVGIAKDRQQAIFNRFVQAEYSLSRPYEGAGLGLSISKAYTEMLGGKIWVESEIGKGSQFYFTIPYEYNNEEIIASKTSIQETVLKRKVKDLFILVVEDEEVINQAYIAIIIKNLGKKIIYAKTGIEAVELCKKNPDIDLVLMDIKMPEMDGYEATRKIRKFNKDVIIIAQTAYAQRGDREKTIEAGCNDYISKPINKDELFEIIGKYFIYT